MPKNTHLFPLIFFLFHFTVFFAQSNAVSVEDYTAGMERQEGFFSFYYDFSSDRILLEVPKAQLGVEFLYVHSLPAGLGSNDIGLDRGQLGRERVVKFLRAGHKLLLEEQNYSYRALSKNPSERQSVEEAFAKSVLWGFEIQAESEGKVLIDLTAMLLSDAHGVAQRLNQMGEGVYRISQQRSAVYLPRCKAFPKNTELEAMVTFEGQPVGKYLPTVVPSPEFISLRMHHSFIQLPEEGFQMRPYDPRCGYFFISFKDYASPFTEPLEKRYIIRHRLEKKHPEAVRSEPVEPIVYYIDPGVPEPMRSALKEGAAWWNEAFEDLGYIRAFRIEDLPEGADPMDVRYNLIQWVHRSTRGWSYGGSVIDPRTGEIIKGHVSLGSLRIRQDFLLAQGLLAPYGEDSSHLVQAREMALARLRQLAAHEVGHTLGLAHNFAASCDGRSSVMDYPHPYITVNEQGELNTAEAYEVGIGAWDKRAIAYGYAHLPKGRGEDQLQNILAQTIAMGLRYISDEGARPAGSMHPCAHLWDNGNNAVDELERILRLRKRALSKFSLDNLPPHMPVAELEHIFTPLYLMHRYQVEAVAKWIGGVEYSYAVKDDGQLMLRPLPKDEQLKAAKAILKTLDYSHLQVPHHIQELLLPPPPAYKRDREYLPSWSGNSFDADAAKVSLLDFTFGLLLHPERLSRMQQLSANYPEGLNVEEYFKFLFTRIFKEQEQTPPQEMLSFWLLREKRFVVAMLHVAASEEVNPEVAALAQQMLLSRVISKTEETGNEQVEISPNEFDFNFGDSYARPRAHKTWIVHRIMLYLKDPSAFRVEKMSLPPGSPIGCGL